MAVTTEVPAGQSKSVRLRSLPQGTVLTVAISSTGRVLVALVGAKELKRARSRAKALFRGAIERKVGFGVTIPESDDYYLVLNNRKGTEALTVETQIRAVSGRKQISPKKLSVSSAPARSRSA